MYFDSFELLDEFHTHYRKIRELVMLEKEPVHEVLAYLRRQSDETSVSTVLLRLQHGILHFESMLEKQKETLPEQINSLNTGSAERRRIKMRVIGRLLTEAGALTKHDDSCASSLRETCARVHDVMGSMSEKQMDRCLNELVEGIAGCLVSREPNPVVPPDEARLLLNGQPNDHLCAAAALYLIDRRKPLFGEVSSPPEVVGAQSACRWRVLAQREHLAMDSHGEQAVSHAVQAISKCLIAAVMITAGAAIGGALLKSVGLLCGGVLGGIAFASLLHKLPDTLDRFSRSAGSLLYGLKNPLRRMWTANCAPVLEDMFNSAAAWCEHTADRISDHIDQTIALYGSEDDAADDCPANG